MIHLAAPIANDRAAWRWSHIGRRSHRWLCLTEDEHLASVAQGEDF